MRDIFKKTKCKLATLLVVAVFALFLSTTFAVLGATGVGATLIPVGGIDYLGTADDRGAGYGNVTNILTLHHTRVEQGSVRWDGLNRVLTGDATNTSKVWLFSDIIASGIADAAQLGIVYNVNQQGNVNNLTTTLDYFTVQVYDLAGNKVFTTDVDQSFGGEGRVPIANGVGGAGYLFDFNSAAVTGLAPYFSDSTNYYLGATGKVSKANDGAENFYFQNISGATPVPEPATMLLLGSGLVGLAAWGKKKLRK